jgi:hypothetical protein
MMENLSDEFKKLAIKRRCRSSLVSQLKPIYNTPLKIQNEKMIDLLDFCESGLMKKTISSILSMSERRRERRSM